MNIQDFFTQARVIVSRFDEWVLRVAPDAVADHICFKCESAEEFERMRAMFEGESVFVYQSIISKRRIAIVKFLTPIATSLGDISFLELSDQKPDGSQVSGFDHIELYPKSGQLEDFVYDLEEKGIIFEKVVRPHHTTFDVTIFDQFKVRLEDGPLVEKIKKDEMV